MLTIRVAQLKALELFQWKAVEREIAATIRKDFAALASRYDDLSLETLVVCACASARHYGLQRRVDLLSFAVLAASFGDDFHLHSALAWILTDPTIPGDRKMRFLFSETSPAQWRQIAEAAAQGH